MVDAQWVTVGCHPIITRATGLSRLITSDLIAKVLIAKNH